MKYLNPPDLCRELVSIPGPLLGLSVDRKQIGLAISDAAKRKAEPLGTLAWNRKEPHLIASDLQSLVSKHSISALVIGHPFTAPKRRPKAELFVEDIEKSGTLQDLCYTFRDETVAAKWDYKKIGLSPKSHPEYPHMFSDEYAAHEILVFFLLLFIEGDDPMDMLRDR